MKIINNFLCKHEMKRNALKSNIMNFTILLILLFSCNQISYSQPFPNINNDTTYLRKITYEEGGRIDYPYYIDTTGLNGFNLNTAFTIGNEERFYTQFGFTVHFRSKYFQNQSSEIPVDSLVTDKVEILELFSNLKELYGNFYLLDMYQNVNLRGREFRIIFDNLVNGFSAFNYLDSNTNNYKYIRGFLYSGSPVEELGNSIENKKLNSNFIFPNPVQDILTLDTKNENMTNFQYEILEITGNKVLEGTLVNSLNIDVSNISKGIYILKFNSQSQKFIKE